MTLLAGAFFALYKPTSNVSIAGLYRDPSGDGCFSGGEPGSNLVLEGKIVAIEDLVMCNYTDPSREATRTYLFDIPGRYANQRIAGLSGMFGIDEADDVQHPGARAVWTVNQGGRQICAVEASWKVPGKCVVDEKQVLQPDEPLEIRETLVSRGGGSEGNLYLGIGKPRLRLQP
ncbi:hypothetical protein [Modestobacter excelsi]|uniref:hypothetical protein n=1 Tax=Modestobacter excelsi TaxID=2213161 RepID=UPI00110CA503|nr:hypothetical protein [Modestobacter excelsi]